MDLECEPPEPKKARFDEEYLKMFHRNFLMLKMSEFVVPYSNYPPSFPEIDNVVNDYVITTNDITTLKEYKGTYEYLDDVIINAFLS